VEKSLITLAVKILMFFIILGVRPTSTPSPKRDQLVEGALNSLPFSF